VFTQAFTLTFLAEWGDRSQIATIALAAAKNPYGVILGGLVGHAFCTGLAVIGGRMLAARISEKTVALLGGTLFLIFAITSFVYGPDV
jgi:putative Ca2+/H+ antiporter (TMEM165/GDT1 family)